MATMVDLAAIKAATSKSHTTKAEITEETVRAHVCDYTLAVLEGRSVGKKDPTPIERVLKKSLREKNVWYLVLKYGVQPVTGAKVEAVSLEEAKKDAIAYVKRIATGSVQAANKLFADAANKRKDTLEKARKTRGVESGGEIEFEEEHFEINVPASKPSLTSGRKTNLPPIRGRK